MKKYKNYVIISFFIVIVLVILCYFIYIKFLGQIYYPIEIKRHSNMDIEKIEYTGNIKNIEKDGYVNPIIYSITQNRLDLFINNHSKDVFKDINAASGLGERISTYKEDSGGMISELKLSTSPLMVWKNIQLNLGHFYIDRNFLKFFSTENIYKILQKNGVNKNIDEIYLLNPVYSTNNIDTIIACIVCDNDYYFISWDKCRKSIERFKERAMKSYFQGDDYNYFTFYSDSEFKMEFGKKAGTVILNNKEIIDTNCFIYHDCGVFTLSKLIRSLDLKYEKIDNENFVMTKDNKKYKFVFDKNSEWGNVYSLSIFDDEGKELNEYVTCRYINGEYVINNEKYYKIYKVIGDKLIVDYKNLDIVITN